MCINTKKDLRAARDASGALPALVATKDAVQQASFIAQRVLEIRDEGIPLREISVLYRSHYQSMEVQIELARRRIPFRVRSGVRFFEQAHIKDVLGFLRVVQNPKDELGFRRIVKLFPGIGSQSADTLWNLFAGKGLQAMEGALARKGKVGWEQCRSTLLAIADQPPGEAIEIVLKGGYESYLRAQFTNGDARADDIRQLAQYAAQYPSIEAFLNEVCLLTEISAEETIEGAEPDEHLTLSSIHQAKGLEWRAVFVAWLADGRFPSAPSLRDPAGEEEERRCFYVAVTRARDELYLCHPMLAAPRDGERVILRPSRFIEELPTDEEPLWETWSLDEAG